MGKKRVVKKSEEELAQEGKSVDANVAQRAADLGAGKKAVREGRIYISSSYNNTLMSLTDAQGNVLAQVSAGSVGFKGTRKSTPFAASRVAEALSQIAQSKGIGRAEIFVKGIGPGRDSALRSFAARPMEIISIRDVTPVPHNGPTRRKPRRV